MKAPPVAKFNCQSCGTMTASKVSETRGARRLRRCLNCGQAYVTIEVLAIPRREPHVRLTSRPPLTQAKRNADPSW